MPDILMCNTKIFCPLKKKCYRYTAIPYAYQSYSDFNYDVEKRECIFFILNKNYRGQCEKKIV